jgi:hypothetical protein
MRWVTGAIMLAAIASSGVVAAAPGAHAISPPCRMTPREYRQVRPSTNHRLGMTRAFVKEMVGCGGKVVRVESNSRSTLRIVDYKRTAPVGAVARIIYFDDRVDAKCTSPASCDAALAPDP